MKKSGYGVMVATMALGAIAWKACEFESHYPHKDGNGKIFFS